MTDKPQQRKEWVKEAETLLQWQKDGTYLTERSQAVVTIVPAYEAALQLAERDNKRLLLILEGSHETTCPALYVEVGKVCNCGWDNALIVEMQKREAAEQRAEKAEAELKKATAKRRGEMQYEVVEDKKSVGTWRVEAIDHQAEGAVHVTLFAGPEAEHRAHEYVSWMQSRS